MSTALVIADYEYTRQQDALFLRALEEGYSRSRACKVSGYSMTAATVRIQSDTQFASLVADAEQIGKDESLDRLTDMAVHGARAIQRERAVDGETGMPLPGPIVEKVAQKQDVRAAVTVARIKNPEAFVEKKTVEISVDKKLSQQDIQNAAAFFQLMAEREKETETRNDQKA